MVAFLEQFSPVIQALFATIFTWGVTAFRRGRRFPFQRDQPQVAGWHAGFCCWCHDRRQLLVAACSCNRNFRKPGSAFLSPSCYWFYGWRNCIMGH